MIKSLSTKYVIVGHSDNRSEGDTDLQLKKNIFFNFNINLILFFCIGVKYSLIWNKKTIKTLKIQITNVLEKNFSNIIIAYEPVWSIGTGKIPTVSELSDTTKFIKQIIYKIFKNKLPVLYGGSVDSSNIAQFKKLPEIDGFLIGGASKTSKNFIDIIKNYYK